MTNRLIRKYVPDSGNTGDINVRRRCNVLAGTVSAVCGVLLFVVKLVTACLIGSIGMATDAVNHLGDTGASVFTVITEKLRLKAKGRTPFTYGERGYIAIIMSGIFTILAGTATLTLSVERIVKMHTLRFDVLGIICLAIYLLTVLVKIWMFFFNRRIGRMTGSERVMFAAKDSKNDIVLTVIAAAGAVADHFVRFPVDGVIGMVISLIVLVSGFVILYELLSELLGKKGDAEQREKIYSLILSCDGVAGVSGLDVTDMGPGKVFAYAHAEIAGERDFKDALAKLASVEHTAEEELGVILSISPDIMNNYSSRLAKYRSIAEEAIAAADPELHGENYYFTECENRIDLTFDLCGADNARYAGDEKKAELAGRISSLISSAETRTLCHILFREEAAEETGSPGETA